jgi:sulfotransferase family protein
VYVSPIKEPCFFAPEVIDANPQARARHDAEVAGVRAYIESPMERPREHGLVLDWDSYSRLFRYATAETAIGEASVAYLASLDAPRSIRARVPHARIVMVLRNPADRLFDRYLAARDAGTATSFDTWIASQEAADIGGRPGYNSIWPGRYARHLQRYLDVFSAGQVRAYIYDDFVRAPHDILSDLFTFLGVDPAFVVDTSARHNVTMAPRWPRLHGRAIRPLAPAARTVLPPRVTARLRHWLVKPRRRAPSPAERARAIEVYADDIRALGRLLHRDLSPWFTSSARL